MVFYWSSRTSSSSLSVLSVHACLLIHRLHCLAHLSGRPTDGPPLPLENNFLPFCKKGSPFVFFAFSLQRMHDWLSGGQRTESASVRRHSNSRRGSSCLFLSWCLSPFEGERRTLGQIVSLCSCLWQAAPTTPCLDCIVCTREVCLRAQGEEEG